MSKRSRRKKRRARAEKEGRSRDRGYRYIILNAPGASPGEMMSRLLRCIPPEALKKGMESNHRRVADE